MSIQLQVGVRIARRSSRRLHGWEQELDVARAGLRRAQDDATASLIRVRYRTAHEVAIVEKLEAQRLAASLGRGRHVLADGSRVTVIARGNSTTVRVRTATASKTVVWHRLEPVVKVERMRAGHVQVLEKHGADVAVRFAETRKAGFREARYRLHRDGRLTQTVVSDACEVVTI